MSQTPAEIEDGGTYFPHVDTEPFRKDYSSGDKELLDDMFGDEPGQEDRKAAFDAAMSRSINQGVQRVAQISSAKKAKALIDACRHNDMEAYDKVWGTIVSRDDATEVALLLSMTVARIAQILGIEPTEEV